MSEWWTYELSNFLLFSPETYERLIESYNRSMWPWQLAALLSGLAIVAFASRRGVRWANASATVLLALSWTWVAWAFLFTRYAPINFAAKGFALAFAVEAVLLVATEIAARGGSRSESRLVRVSGLTIALLALAGLPLLQRLLGRPWSHVELFGFFPDATAVVTLGVLLARERLDWHQFVIPSLWCVIGSATVRALGRPDAPVAVGAAVVVIGLLVWKTRVTRRSEAEE